MEAKEGSCPICFESLKDKTVGYPDICEHKFCLPCLEKWTKHGDFCPVDRQKFKKIISGEEIIQIKYKRKKQSSALYDISVYCEVCRDVKETNDTVILCDSCDLAYHLECLDPPLKAIPRGNWHCTDCQEIDKKLKAQKTEHEGKMLAPKSSITSKQSSSFRHRLTSLTNQTGLSKVSHRMKNAKLKFTKAKYNHVKQSDLSKRDCYQQKNLFSFETINSPDNSTRTPLGEFEDFFSISDTDVILTKRKALKAEEKSLDKNAGKESRTSSSLNLRPFRQVKNAIPNSSERRTKRLAATIARNKMCQNLKKNTGFSSEFSTDSSSSFGQYSTAEDDSLQNASLKVVNNFVDIKKSVSSDQSSTFCFNNDNNSTNYLEEISLSKQKYTNELGLEVTEEQSTLMQNLNKSAAVKLCDVRKNLTRFANSPDLITEDFNGIDFVTAREKDGCKLSPTTTEIKISVTEKLINTQIHTNLESFNHESLTNYMDPVNEIRLEGIGGENTFLENLNKNTVAKSSSVCENFTTVTNEESPGSISEDLDGSNPLGTSEKAVHNLKASPISTKINNSLVEKSNNAHAVFEPLSVSVEPGIISTNCKSLRIEKKSPDKNIRGESCEPNTSVDSRVLRKKMKLHLTEVRTKRLAAENARKKLLENFDSSNDEYSSDESPDSVDQHSAAEKDSVGKSPLNSRNHYLFENIEKVLSHQNSPLLLESDGYSTSSSACENPGTLSIPKKSRCVTEDLDSKESFSVFDKPGCKSSAVSTKIKNTSETLGNEMPPELLIEPLNTSEKLGYQMPPELLIEPIKTISRSGNEILPIIVGTKTGPIPSVVEDLENGPLSSAFSIFEKITNTSCSAKYHTSKNRITDKETLSHFKDYQSGGNSENELVQEETFSDMGVDGEENIFDSFRIREVHYAIKAKMNLPSELQKIEQETWLSRRSRSSKQYYKSSSKKANIRIPSSSQHQIVSGNEQLYNFWRSNHLDCNKSTYSNKDLSEYNKKFNPFCESVSGALPKKRFKVTEYALQPSDKQFCLNMIPKDTLRNIAGPYGLKYLDIREDGSLFLNWSKSKYQ